MKTFEFHPDQGIYLSSVNELHTSVHAHPAMEIVLAESGSFTLTTDAAAHHGVRFAFIDANVRHGITCENADLKLLLIEHHRPFVRDILTQHGLPIQDFILRMELDTSLDQLLETLYARICAQEGTSGYDPRVDVILNYIHRFEPEYQRLMPTLSELVHLSESRISHLFKHDVGLSLKKYLVWTKLKSTIHRHLNASEELFSSLIESGFYDRPHFSKAYKNMLGINASDVYNSRILQ